MLKNTKKKFEEIDKKIASLQATLCDAVNKIVEAKRLNEGQKLEVAKTISAMSSKVDNIGKSFKAIEDKLKKEEEKTFTHKPLTTPPTKKKVAPKKKKSTTTKTSEK